MPKEIPFPSHMIRRELEAAEFARGEKEEEEEEETEEEH